MLGKPSEMYLKCSNKYHFSTFPSWGLSTWMKYHKNNQRVKKYMSKQISASLKKRLAVRLYNEVLYLRKRKGCDMKKDRSGHVVILKSGTFFLTLVLGHSNLWTHHFLFIHPWLVYFYIASNFSLLRKTLWTNVAQV